MKVIFRTILSLFFSLIYLFLFSCSEKDSTKNGTKRKSELSSTKVYTENEGFKYAKKELENAKISDEFSPNKVIPNSQTAVDIAESILFPIYGKDNIIKQRPYDLNFIDGYYIINGTFSEQISGTFIIILNAKDGK